LYFLFVKNILFIFMQENMKILNLFYNSCKLNALSDYIREIIIPSCTLLLFIELPKKRFSIYLSV